jgi:hypothetical protein
MILITLGDSMKSEWPLGYLDDHQLKALGSMSKLPSRVNVARLFEESRQWLEYITDEVLAKCREAYELIANHPLDSEMLFSVVRISLTRKFTPRT